MTVTRRLQKAFTLVELLVVIGIISILIAILLPALNRVQDAAQSTKCLANMQQVALCTAMYTNDNKGKWLVPYVVPYRSQNYSPTGVGFGGAPFFYTYLSGIYLKEAPGMWVCPTDLSQPLVASQMRLNSNIRDTRTSYFMNRDLPQFRLPIYPTPYEHVYFSPHPLNRVKSTTRLIVFGESNGGVGLYSYRSASVPPAAAPFRFDHRKGRVMSLSFADGHAEQLDRSEITLRTGEVIHGPGRIREYWYGHPQFSGPQLYDR